MAEILLDIKHEKPLIKEGGVGLTDDARRLTGVLVGTLSREDIQVDKVTFYNQVMRSFWLYHWKGQIYELKNKPTPKELAMPVFDSQDSFSVQSLLDVTGIKLEQGELAEVRLHVVSKEKVGEQSKGENEEADKEPYVLACTFAEPELGGMARVFALTKREVKQLEEVILWLHQHAKDELGGTLASWSLCLSSSTLEDADFEDALAVLSLDSRYEETEIPGEFYGARHPLLDSVITESS